MNKSKPLVSVIIPTYSRPYFLERAINSILSQTYTNIEIIVVDDNEPSSDYRKETENVMNQYKNNTKVKYFRHSKNRNGSAARNTGWNNSSGEYITFVDDDDVLDNSKIEEQVKCLENLDDEWGACYTAYKIVKQNGKNQVSNEKRQGNCYVYALMRTMFMGSGSNLFLRKKVVDEINGYDESFKRNQDVEFLVRVTEKYKIAFIDKNLLTIYQESERKKRSFNEIENITNFYLQKFNSRINKLSKKDKKRVITVISLERFRICIYKKKYLIGFKILASNKVGFVYLFKYIFYLIKRSLTNESYGFYI